MNQVMTIIRSALSAAINIQETAESPKDLHRERSRNWVESLAEEFRKNNTDDSIKVFSKHYDGNREAFLLNELLYDICVCRVGKVPSATHKKELYYVKEALWQIESEFAKDSRQAVVDFNKLVLGAAKKKLFIGPQVNDTKSFMEVLAPPAAACSESESVFLCLIPHPAEWDRGKEAFISLWIFQNGSWQKYEE